MTRALPCFAYGSNLVQARMVARCAGARVLAEARLEDHRLAFTGFSAAWRGAVATAQAWPEAVLPGRLYALGRADWKRLDRYENVRGGDYQRVEIEVRVGGETVKAAAYQKPPGELEGPPSVEYAQEVVRGYRECGFRLESLTAALARLRRHDPPGRVRLFVYGTLKWGRANSRFLRHTGYLGQARTAPSHDLLEVGGYPALLERGRRRIVGEVYSVDATTLARIDRLEGHPNWYRRKPVRLDDGTSAEAYFLPDDAVSEGQPIGRSEW